MQSGAGARFQIEAQFAASRTGRHRRAKGIKESGRGKTITGANYSLLEGNRLVQRDLIGVAVMFVVAGGERIAAVNHLTLTARKSKSQNSFARQAFLTIDAAQQE